MAACAGISLLILLPCGVVFAEESEELRLALHFDDTELSRVVAAVAEATNTRFVFDERLQGRVTIHVPRRVTFEEALEILDVALRLRGFVAIPTPGGPLRIAPLDEQRSAAPFRRTSTPTAAVVTTIYDLEFAEPEAIVRIVTPLAGSGASIVPIPSTPTLILAGAGADLHRLLQIIAALDVPDGDVLRLFRPRHRSAGELLPTIEAALAPLRGSRAPRVLAVDHGNALVVLAAPDMVARTEELLAQLDRLPTTAGEVQVVPLAHANAEELAETLTSLASGAGRRIDSARVGEETSTFLQEQDWSAIPHVASNSLLLRGSPEVLRELHRIIDQLDLERTLIRVDAQIIEFQSDVGRDLAIDAIFTGSFGSGNDAGLAVESITSGSGDLIGGSAPGRILDLTRGIALISGPDGQPIAIPGQQIAVLAEQREVRIRTLLEPRLTLLNGDEGEISVGDNIPVPVQRAQAEGGIVDPLQTNVEIQRQDVSTLLRVRATTSQEDGSPIRMELTVESSSLAPSLAGDVELVGPTIRTRRLEATLTLAEGETKLIGGRSLPGVARREIGIPFLRRIPLLGWAARSERIQRSESLLAIIVRAHTLRDPVAVEADTIRSRLAYERHLEGLESLAQRANGPWALHLATAEAGECEALARQVPAPVERLVALAREGGNDAACDLYLVDFDELGHATRAAERLSRLGWDPRILAVPR